MVDRSHDVRNTAQRERLRALGNRLDDGDLACPLDDGWTAAVALAHLADWDRGALAALEDWLRTGAWPPFAGADAINAAGLATWQAVPPRDAVRRAVAAAEGVDVRIRALPDAQTIAAWRENPRLLDRSHHRRAHLDQIEHAVRVRKRRDEREAAGRIRYDANDEGLAVERFLALVQRVWPGIYDSELTRLALRRTINVTAWHDDDLVGCVRLLSDGSFFGTITEILVDPAWQRQGIGRRLMELAWEASPTGLFFGAQPGNEGFFEKLGFERSLQSYARRKPRQGAG